MSIIRRLREAHAPAVHFKDRAKAKLSNTNKTRFKHFRYRVTHNKVANKIRSSFDQLLRTIRSKRLHIRFVTKAQAVCLDATLKNKPINFKDLSNTNLADTERTINEWEEGSKALLENFATVRELTQQEQENIENKVQREAERHKAELITANIETIDKDNGFARDNPKLVGDYAMHQMLYEGIPTGPESKDKKSLLTYFNQIKNTFETERTEKIHQLNKRREIEEGNIRVDQSNTGALEEVKVIDAQLAELNAQQFDDDEGLKQAMNAFKKDVTVHRKNLIAQQQERRIEARKGESILRRKPRLYWETASAHGMHNLLTTCTDESSLKGRDSFRDFMRNHEKLLNLPSSHYALLGGSPLSEEVESLVAQMDLVDGKVIHTLAPIDPSLLSDRAVAKSESEEPVLPTIPAESQIKPKNKYLTLSGPAANVPPPVPPKPNRASITPRRTLTNTPESPANKDESSKSTEKKAEPSQSEGGSVNVQSLITQFGGKKKDG